MSDDNEPTHTATKLSILVNKKLYLHSNGQSRTPVPTRITRLANASAVGEDIILPHGNANEIWASPLEKLSLKATEEVI